MSEHNSQLITMSEYVPYPPTEQLLQAQSKGYVPFGADNLYPDYLQALYLESPTHGAVSNTISQMVYGDGLVVNVGNLDKVVKALSKDVKLYGGAYIEVQSNGIGEPVVINTLPYVKVRRGERSSGQINHVMYSEDWAQTGKYKPVRIPTYNRATFGTEGNLRQVMIIDVGKVGNNVYPLPDYIASVKAIDLERQMSELHLANIENGMFPSLMVNFNSGIPKTKEARDEVVDEFKGRLRGAQKAGKMIVSFNEGKDTETTVQVMETTNADKMYEQMGKNVVEQIMRGHRVTSPRLMGVLESTGLGNSAEELSKSEADFYKWVIIPTRESIEDELKPLGELLGVKIRFKMDFNDNADNDTAYDGNQIATIIQVVTAVQSGEMTKEQGINLLVNAIGYAEDAAKELFPEDETQTPTPSALKLSRDITELETEAWLAHLEAKGEKIDLDVWELISETEAKSSHEEGQYKPTFLSLETYATPEEKSAWGDAGLYKLRYAYSQNITANSRKFCQEMVRLSASGTVYRYEDIIRMGDDGENGQFAPQGESTYSIFDWKGGVYCHHHWKRQIYFRKRGENGAFLPNKGLDNDQRVANVPFVPQKGLEGIAPIDTPSRGSLKNA